MTEHNEHQIFKADGIPCQEISDPAVLSKIPLVSVHMITYNHEPYIAQAIEGVLMQETDFPIELIIGEDCSTDSTREIVLDYQKKHPEIIRVITSDHNIGALKNMLRTAKACRGKYIAYCEGDDYWHHSLKLQKQVDYLENHPDVGLVHANVDRTDIETGIKKPNACNIGDDYQKIGIYYSLLLGHYSIYTCTVCLRRTLIEKIKNDNPEIFNEKFKMGDIQMWLLAARISKVVYFPKSMATYKAQSESASHSENVEKRIEFIQTCYEVRKLFMAKYYCPKFIQDKIRVEYNKDFLRLACQSQNPELAHLSFAKLMQYSTQRQLFADRIRYLIAIQKNKSIYKVYQLIGKILRKN